MINLVIILSYLVNDEVNIEVIGNNVKGHVVIKVMNVVLFTSDFEESIIMNEEEVFYVMINKINYNKLNYLINDRYGVVFGNNINFYVNIGKSSKQEEKILILKKSNFYDLRKLKKINHILLDFLYFFLYDTFVIVLKIFIVFLLNNC